MEFQSLIGILQTKILIPCRSLCDIVSIPYRYSTNLTVSVVLPSTI